MDFSKIENIRQIARIGPNEQEIEYDAAAKKEGVYDETIFEYIGFGYIGTINGVEQGLADGTRPPLHFWKRCSK